MSEPYVLSSSSPYYRRYSSSVVQGNGSTQTTRYNVYCGNVGRDLAGVKDKNWRHKVKMKKNATTSLVASETQLKVSAGSISIDRIAAVGPSYRNTTVTDTVVGRMMDPLSPSIPSSAYDSDLLNEALNIFYKKARDAQSELQGAISSGEYGETVRMVNNRARRFRSGLFNYLATAKTRALRLKRGRGNRVTDDALLRQRSRTVAETWLEYSFGWSPLIADIKGGVAAIKHSVTGIPVASRYCTGQAVKYTQTISSPVVNTFGGNASCLIYRKIVREYSARVYGEVRVDGGNSPSALQHLGFQPHLFVPTVWELLPWSFLVDYFVDVGGWLNAMSFPTSKIAWMGRTFRRNSVATRSGALIAAQVKANIGANYVGCSGSPGTGTWTVKQVDRASLGPSTVISYPVLRIPTHFRQILNMGALLRTSTTVRASLLSSGLSKGR